MRLNLKAINDRNFTRFANKKKGDTTRTGGISLGLLYEVQITWTRQKQRPAS